MAEDEKPRQWPAWFAWDVLWPRLSRLAALAISVNEFFIEPKPRPEAIVIVGTLITVPIAAKIDRRNRDETSGP